MERQLFDAVQQKLTDQWSHRNHAKSKSDHLLTGLLYDDAGHRMIPTHATKAGIRYRYYVSLPHLKGESKTVSVGSVSRIPATDIEDIIVRSVNEHLVAQRGQPGSSSAHADDRGVMIAEQVVRIDVHKNRLIVRFKSAGTEEESADGQLLSIPWQKPPSRKSRQILIPLSVPRNEVRPIRIERRARLVGAISRGRRWLDEIVSGSAANIEHIATRQKCSVRQVNITISLAFLAPDLVKSAIGFRSRAKLTFRQPIPGRRRASKPSRQERNFWMQRPEPKNPPERPLCRQRPGNVENRRQHPRRNGLFSIENGFRGSGRLGGGVRSRMRTRLSGDSTLETAAIRCFPLSLVKTGNSKSKGFRFPCVLSVGFRAM